MRTTGTDRTTERRARERVGRRAETLAAAWLMLKGYRILARRVRTPAGEIDIIAARGRIIAFVEVKARRTRALALEAVTPHLIRRVEQAASLWAGRRRKLANAVWRYDIIAITPNQWPHHLRGAWRPES